MKTKMFHFLNKILPKIIMIFGILFMVSAAKAQFESETVSPKKLNDKVLWSIDKVTHQPNTIVVISGDSTETRISANGNRTSTYDRIDHSNYTIEKSQPLGEHFGKIKITRRGKEKKLEVTLRLSKNGQSYYVSSIINSAYKVYYSSGSSDSENQKIELALSTCSAEEPIGHPTEQFQSLGNSIQASAQKAHPAIEKEIDPSCIKNKEKLLQSLGEIYFPKKDSSPKYVACMERIPSLKEPALKLIASLEKQIEDKKSLPTIRCVQSLAPGKIASFEENVGIRMSNDGLNRPLGAVKNDLFHELMHFEGFSETLTADTVACCSGGFSDHTPACNKLMGRKEALETEDIKQNNFHQGFDSASKPDTESLLNMKTGEASADSAATSTAMTFKPGRADEHEQVIKLAAQSESAMQRTVSEAKRVTAIVENQILPQANASEARAESRTEDRSAKLTSKPTENDEPQTQPRTQQRVARNNDETKSYDGLASATTADSPAVTSTVTGYESDGSPTVSVNGRQIPTFTAFANVQPAGDDTQNAQSLRTLGSAQAQSGSVTRGAASEKAAPRAQMIAMDSESRSATGSMAKQSAGAAQDQAANSGATASEGTSFAQSGSSTASQSPNSAAQQQPTQHTQQAQQSLAAPQVKISQADGAPKAPKPTIETPKDVLKVLRQAQSPTQLLKEPWFVKHLERLQIQIVDGGIGYGSKTPKTRWNLKAFVKETAP